MFCFLDNGIWTGHSKFWLVQIKYLSSTDNVLRNIGKISYVTKREIIQRNLPESDEQIWQKCRASDLSSVWDP